MQHTMCTVDDVIDTIRRYRFLHANEHDLHTALVDILTRHRIPVREEVALTGRGRIDLVVNDRIGIEIKVAGSTIDVTRQLQRYAATGRVDALILVTSVARHRDIPASAGGIPVHVVRARGVA